MTAVAATCPRCRNLGPARVEYLSPPERDLALRCSRCGHIFRVSLRWRCRWCGIRLRWWQRWRRYCLVCRWERPSPPYPHGSRYSLR